MPFHALISPILLSLDSSNFVCKPQPHTLPIHLPGSQFTRKDYDDYIDQDSFTTACLFVGIYYIWCLVVATISLDKVLHGPLALAAGNQMLSVNLTPYQSLVDDALTEVKLPLICGAYRCYAGLHMSFSFSILSSMILVVQS